MNDSLSVVANMPSAPLTSMVVVIEKGLLQGPVFISGTDSPFAYPLTDPLMLPVELALYPVEFLVPSNVTIDTTMYLVDEAKQVDTVIMNNLNVRGTNASIGTLFAEEFVGMNMANAIAIGEAGTFSGISYEEVEVMIWNLGDGSDVLTVENTSEGEWSRPVLVP